MPKQMSWTLPKNKMAASNEAQPMGVDGSLILLITTQKTPKNASAENNKPIKVTTRSGKIQVGVTHPSVKEEDLMIGRGHLYPVARFEPSPDGLYDLVGNGLDWVNDWYAPGYSAGSAVDPQGPDSGTEKVLRGMPEESMVDYRYLKRFHRPADNAAHHKAGKEPFVYAIQGFRCALNTAQPANPKGGQPPVTPTLKPEPWGGVTLDTP
jgi:formylglycine-generating enzyme required for sulfatase activity